MELEFLEKEWANAVKREEQLNAALDEMKAIYKKGVAREVDDLVKFLADPSGYVVAKYWETYCKDRPAHLDKVQVFTSDTGIVPNTLESIKTRFYKAFEQLRDSAPIITKTAVRSGLKRSDYCLHLDEDKKEEYDALMDFLNAAKVLKEKFGAGGDFHLLRYGNKLRMGINSVIEPNPYEFRKMEEFNKAI